jgi:hypothetical protein
MSQLPKSATLAEEEPRVQPAAAKGDGWREESIRARVLAALGRPAGLVKVAVLPVWGNHFRVNVWADGGSASIPHSYFVTADERGAILDAEPPIERRY